MCGIHNAIYPVILAFMLRRHFQGQTALLAAASAANEREEAVAVLRESPQSLHTRTNWDISQTNLQ